MKKTPNIRQEVWIGDMDRRITIQSGSVTVNEYHGESLTWADVATVWAKVDWQASPDESQQADRKTATTKVDFTIRYAAAYRDKKLRISYDGMLFDVQTVLEIGRRRFLKLETKLYE